MLGIWNRRARNTRTRYSSGFTLVELMITVVVLGIIALSLSAVMMTASRSKTSTANQVESLQAARSTLGMIVSDLRSAGYNADRDWPQPQRPIAYVDSVELLINANLAPYPDGAAPHTAPQAYDPVGVPRPRPLDGTAWQPPIKYRTGAEVIRYTLDTNNDGVINSADVTGTPADRTKNPNDFVMVRQVYGDSVGNVAGNNGPFRNESIALVRKVGGTVPPTYTVYLRGSDTPWNWSNGPVPTSQLGNIDRVLVQIVAPSAKPDSKGNYAETVLRSEVNAARNVPNWGVDAYNVDGYVYDDLNKNHVRDAGEGGIQGVTVRLGTVYTAITGANGYFTISSPAGTQTLRHYPTANYGNFNSPDTFSVTAPPATSRLFADTARAGGWANIVAFEDLDDDRFQDAGEPGKAAVKVTLNPAGTVAYTDLYGNVSLFIQEGGYSLGVTPPDSFAVTSTNPQAGSMPNGGSASHVFALKRVPMGTVAGTVYRDNNRNATFDGGDVGMQNIWVGVTTDGGVSIQGFTYTDASGRYSMLIPINDPPHTIPYSIFITPPSGFFATSPTAIRPIWLQSGQTLSNNNFGVASYQVITLNASRVLSLSSGDLEEKDWPGSTTSDARKDADLILGADAGGSDNISVWFNQYNTTPTFTASPTYTRLAANSVLSLALDTLDANVSPFTRKDVVTGTKYTPSGNLFTWYNQNSSGNQGYLPSSPSRSYKTSNLGDVQSVLILDCAGGSKLDIIAGTKSPTAGQGTIEIWQNDDTSNPAFSRQEIYPPAGSIPGNALGEVTCMALADFDNDGRKDLVAGTKTSSYNGQLVFFRNVSKVNGARFICQRSYTVSLQAVTSVTCLDVNGDSYQDVAIGTQTSTSSGKLHYWQNDKNPVTMSFSKQQEVAAPGIVMSLTSADFGGLAGKDIAVGWRASESGYGGGLTIYYCDLGDLPPSGTDPSAGSISNMVPALTANDFNYGVKPSPPSPPFLIDLAAGTKTSATTGALVVFIR